MWSDTMSNEVVLHLALLITGEMEGRFNRHFMGVLNLRLNPRLIRRLMALRQERRHRRFHYAKALLDSIDTVGPP